MERDEFGRFVKGHTSLLTEKSKKKTSETCKKKGVGKWMLGKKHSEQTRIKIRQNSARYWLGKKRPDMTGRNHPNWKEKPIKILTYGKGRKRLDTRERMLNHNPNKGKFGKKHPRWVEDKKSPLYKAVRNTYKYKEWRSIIFIRDNFTCVLCGASKTYLEADHYPKRFIDIIREYGIKTFDEVFNCEELWKINNGRTLCRKCHLNTPTWGKRLS